jgi:hypothetical protein
MEALYIQPEMATVKWKLAEFMKTHDVSAYELGLKLGGHTRMSQAYRLASAKKPPARVDFSTMGEIIRALNEITDSKVQLTDLLEFDPTDKSN